MREGRLQGPSIDGGRCHGGNEGCGGSPGRGRPSLLLSGTDGLKGSLMFTIACFLFFVVVG